MDAVRLDPSSNAIPRVWFDDGNLIIEAGSSRFRIFKGLLAEKSSVFSTMLSLPQSLDEKLVDACPVIRFQDSAQDVGYFLKAIYDACFFEPPPAETHPSIIARILRLSIKYDVPYLRRRALQHLDICYPLTLSKFDRRNKKCTFPLIKNASLFLSVIARELDLLWLLPAILCCIYTESLPHVASGFTWDGTIMQMAPIDRDACLGAIAHLVRAEHQELLDCLMTTNVDGCRSTACTEERLTLLRDQCCGPDLLDPFDERWVIYPDLVCGPCVEDARSMHQSARECLWDRLPDIFGLPSWGELMEMQGEALKS